MALVTLTTDFGPASHYVGVMKGVILSIAREVQIVDLCHDLPAFDLVAAAITLDACIDHFPPGTVHVVVVDPGVGSSRRPIAVQTNQGFLVGPDNGVFSAVLARRPVLRAVCLSNRQRQLESVSATFHGRDIFAPAAAWLAQGTPIDDLGDTANDLQTLDIPTPVEQSNGGLLLKVLRVDPFGNLITNLTQDQWDGWNALMPQSRAVFHVGSAQIVGLSRTFSDVAPGSLLAYIGCSQRVEIAARQGHAASRLNAKPGAPITLTKAK